MDKIFQLAGLKAAQPRLLLNIQLVAHLSAWPLAVGRKLVECPHPGVLTYQSFHHTTFAVLLITASSLFKERRILGTPPEINNGASDNLELGGRSLGAEEPVPQPTKIQGCPHISRLELIFQGALGSPIERLPA